MNKDLLNQLPADEQPVASKLTSVAEDMQLSPSFEWDLKTQLMGAAKKKTRRGWNTKILTSLGWAGVAIGAIFLLNWTVRSLASHPPVATQVTPEMATTFESDVRQGRICTGPLALASNSSMFLTNQDKTGFVTLDKEKKFQELRTFAWSPDGKQLAMIAVLIAEPGHGNLYFTDSTGSQLQRIPSGGDLEYLAGVTWSHDGKRLLLWSIPDNRAVYLMNADGTDFIKKELYDTAFSETPQFTPDDKSIIFYSDRLPVSGLVEATLDSKETRVISRLATQGDSYAWSPDGTRLAYIEIDRDQGEVRIVMEEMDTGKRTVIEHWSIPKGTFPAAKNLTWSSDGKNLVFEFSRDVPDPDNAIYLARVDGSGLVKLVDPAYTPTISADGRCLAYIKDNQVLVMDLNNSSSTPVLVSDLPAGNQPADPELDKLQWQP